MATDAPRIHTLDGLLVRLQDAGGERDPELARRLDAAFAKHEGWLRRRCRIELRGSSPEQVEEVVQDSLLTAWRRLSEYRPQEPFRAWLAVIALNHCRNLRRKRRDLLSESGLVDPADESASVYLRLAEDQRDGVLQEAARAVLDDREQEIVQLRYVHAYPSDQIAELAGLASVDEVRVILQRCQRRLGKELRRRLVSLGHTSSFFRP